MALDQGTRKEQRQARRAQEKLEKEQGTKDTFGFLGAIFDTIGSALPGGDPGKDAGGQDSITIGGTGITIGDRGAEDDFAGSITGGMLNNVELGVVVLGGGFAVWALTRGR